MLEIAKIAVISYVVTSLMEGGMIFHWWYNLIEKLPQWLFFPLGGCAKCFAGQVGLWYYLIAHFSEYNLWEHIFFISGVILLVMILDRLLC